MAQQHLNRHDDEHPKPGLPDETALDAESFMRHRSCTGKHPYETRTAAEADIPYLHKKWRLDGATVWLEAYLCPCCRKFHLGRNYRRQ